MGATKSTRWREEMCLTQKECAINFLLMQTGIY
jgi:hypothetical protein